MILKKLIQKKGIKDCEFIQQVLEEIKELERAHGKGNIDIEWQMQVTLKRRK